jgi:uncharacterized protein
MRSSKMIKLNNIIGSNPKAIVAFSGGVDSTLLLRLCSDILGRRNVLAVTGVSQTYTEEEKREASKFAGKLGVKHMLLETDELACREFAENPGNRCYYCKLELYRKIAGVALKKGFPVIFDATNVDDLADYRPGRRAAEERGVISPFVLAGFTKRDIRDISKKIGLPSWDKPANPCLASRVPYGTRITEEVLEKIHAGEKFIRDLGFPVVRLRHHDELARIEIPAEDFPRVLKRGTLQKIAAHLKSLGYLWIALDIEGYRTGSLNRSLARPARPFEAGP